MPTEVPPSEEGEITGVAWAVRVVLEVPRGPGVEAEAPITVLSARETYAERSEAEQQSSPSRDVRIHLRLDDRDIRAGERIEGRLVVGARHPFEAREVRVELVRRELVLRDEGNRHETVEAEETVADRIQFRPRTTRAVPFDIAVPRESVCPCSETKHTYVGWYLRGTIDGARRAEYAVEQELNVYNGPRKD